MAVPTENDLGVKFVLSSEKFIRVRDLLESITEEQKSELNIDISNPETILARIIYTEHMYRRPRPQVDVDNLSLELDSDSDSDIRILSDVEEPKDDETGENQRQVETQPLLSIGARTFLQACEEAFGRAAAARREQENGPGVADDQGEPATRAVGPSGSTEYGPGVEDEREPATPAVGPSELSGQDKEQD